MSEVGGLGGRPKVGVRVRVRRTVRLREGGGGE